MIKILKYGLPILALLLLTQTTQAQTRINDNDDKQTNTKSRMDGLTINGIFGFGLSNAGWSIELSPGVGYAFLNDRFIGGAGLKYSHNVFFVSSNNDRTIQNTIGPRVFLQGHVFNGYYGHFEAQFLTIKQKFKADNGEVTDGGSFTETPLYLGGGMNRRFADGLGFNVEMLYHLNYDGPQTANLFNRLVYRFGVSYTF